MLGYLTYVAVGVVLVRTRRMPALSGHSKRAVGLMFAVVNY